MRVHTTKKRDTTLLMALDPGFVAIGLRVLMDRRRVAV